MADISDEKLRKKIKDILKNADLTALSAKKVRIKLQSSFSIDLADRKKEIDKMTMGLIMEMEEEKKKQTEEKEEEEVEEEKSEDESEQRKNGKVKKSSESEADEELEEKEPPKKKAKSKESKSSTKKGSKKSKQVKDLDDMAPLDNDVVQIYDEEQKTLKMSDEELAQRLQSFEETGRRTRGKATPRKKPGEKKERKGTSTYSKPCFLSADLAALMGTDKMARNEVVKKMWEIVKERKLEDPNDRRFMLCDEQLQKIFGRKRLQTFGMMKYLSSHIRDEGPSLEKVITNSDIYDDEADDD